MMAQAEGPRLRKGKNKYQEAFSNDLVASSASTAHC